MTELDKFKRRTIRSVARLLYQEKKPPEELWAQMKKETGTDCRVLWERMRALCVKKLNRMIAVDDRSACLPSIARLSLTDWLLVDLVLVHENIDVINMEKADSKEYPALIELFSLVQRFDIEGKEGSSLAEAWAAATVFYNRQGRQCSPMLLQRRWYQLKKLTRARFYKFWHSYRGNLRLLAEARKAMPTRLQMAIAKRYPKVITGEFPDWKQLIEKNFIIMPEEFEAKMRLPNLPKPCNSNDPDLVLVEPIIETIELGGDSDPEELNEDHIEDLSDPEKSNDATDITDSNEPPTKDNELSQIKFKTEPVEQDGLSNVQLISATHVPEVEIPDENLEEKSPAVAPQDNRMDDSPDVNEDNVIEIPSDIPTVNNSEPTDEILDKNLEEEKRPDVAPQDNLMEDSPDVFEDDVIEIPSDIPTVNNSKPTDDTVEKVKEMQEDIHVSKSQIDNSSGDDDIIEIPSIVPALNVDLDLPTDNNTPAEAAEKPPGKCSASSDVIALNESDDFDDIIKIKADEFCRKSNKEVPVEKEVPSQIDDLIKDKVETFLKKPIDKSFIDKKPDINIINLTNNLVETTAMDLMADLNFIDDGIEFVDDGVEFVEEGDTQKVESTEKAPACQSKEDVGENNKFDLKLLMDPVVYTTKLDQMQVFTNKQYDTVNKIEDIQMAVIESKPVSKKSFKINASQKSVASVTDDAGDNNDDLFINHKETDEEEEDDDEIENVSPNSYMLKKPRTRSYDPIKLCKNPDFNTKLKRLTIGFLSSTRNRQLLNACIPMTIDLSKAFESKLVNNTLYLKSISTVPNIAIQTNKQEVIDKQASSIVPSAMSVQSLIDNSKGDIQNLISKQPMDPIVSERQKVIKLPDIEKVRRINQQLLTAQVPPLRVYAGNNHNLKPPTPPDLPDEVETLKGPVIPKVPPPVSGTVPNNESDNIPATKDTTPTIVKVKSEATADQKAVLESEETIPPETLPPAKEKLLKIINQAKISTQEALVKIDSGTKPDDFPKPIVVKDIKPKIPQEIPRRHYRQPRVSLAWAPKYGNAPQNLDDFLLTNDTLEKILHLLMSGDKNGAGCKCCKVKPKKPQVKKGRPKATSEKKEQKETDNSESVQADKKSETAQKEEVPVPALVPINIDDSPPPPPRPAKKKVLAQGRVFRYCCWARQKICNRKRITKHTCPPEQCNCCCREQFAKLQQEQRENEANKNPAIELSDDEVSLRKACESIENVVLQSREISQSQDPAVVRTVSTNTDFNLASISDVSPKKFSVDVAVGPMRPLLEPTTPPKIPRVTTKIVGPPELVKSKKVILEPRVKQSEYTKQAARCPCQKPSLSQDSQRCIVIDGSKSCPFHPVPIVPRLDKIPPVSVTPKQDSKVLYLHSKSIAKSPSESPIFLGKNKILLTTVKFPRESEEVAPESEVLHTPKIIPTLPLPAGVQLVLMPSGNVTYTLDPGVELDETQLATLPAIIAAVQEQLNSSGQAAMPIVDPQVVPTGTDLQSVVDPSQAVINSGTNLLQTGVTVAETAKDPHSESNLVTETSDLLHATDNIISETVEPSISLTTDEVFQDTALPPKITNTEDMEVDATKSTNIDEVTQAGTSDKENTTTVIENKLSDGTVNLETANNNVPVEPVSTQTPIVDVMKVSNKIQTPSLVENSEETKKADTDGINNKKNLLSDLMEMSGISAEDATAPEPMVLDPPSVEMPQTTSNVVINADQGRNLPELSPVTSFAELKYACEQNGKFFKLDFETGVIVPINVCIKRNPKNKIPIPVNTKDFIDLTDEVENKELEPTKETTAGPSAFDPSLKPLEYIYNGKAVSVSNVVTPVKLFRAFRPAPTVLKRPRRAEPLETTSVNRQTHKEKRKQSLNRIEARIDLVDSDEPMEEEYLEESSDDESSSVGEPLLVESLDLSALNDSDDSSDDEPLAKKFKRLKETEDNVKETNIYDEIVDVPDPSVLTQSVMKDLGTIEIVDVSQVPDPSVLTQRVINDLGTIKIVDLSQVPDPSVLTQSVMKDLGTIEIVDMPQVPDPSLLTQSVMKDLSAIDTPLLSRGGKSQDLAPKLKPTSQLIDDPAPSVSVNVKTDKVPSLKVRNDITVPSLNVRTDTIPSMGARTDMASSLNVRTDITVPSLNVRTDTIPSLGVRTDIASSLNVKTDITDPSLNVRTDSISSLSVRTDLVPSSNVRTDAAPSLNVRPDIAPSLNVRTDLVTGTGSPDFDDSDEDVMPQLKFMSDQSDGEEGEDCILGV